MSRKPAGRGIDGVVAIVAALALLGGLGVTLGTSGHGPVRVETEARSSAARHVRAPPWRPRLTRAAGRTLPALHQGSPRRRRLPPRRPRRCRALRVAVVLACLRLAVSSPAFAFPSAPSSPSDPLLFSGFPAPGLPAPPFAPSSPPPANPAPVSVTGLIGFGAPELLGDDSSIQLQQLGQMKSMGMNTVRVDANWFVGEPSQGNFNWSTLDQIMASVRQVGMTADLIIDGCPPWAAAAGATGQFAQPASPAQFGAWAAAVAARYGSLGAGYFEIWNEPNISAFWSPTPDPAAYTADLIAAYAAIKAVAPSAVVITGGLAPAADSSNSYDIVTFFADMYADGAQGTSTRSATTRTPSRPTPATPSQGAWGEMVQTSPSLRSLMTAHGDGAKKIWITEFGAPTAPTDAQQTTELTEAITAAKNTSWIGAFYIYTWSDQFGGERLRPARLHRQPQTRLHCRCRPNLLTTGPASWFNTPSNKRLRKYRA